MIDTTIFDHVALPSHVQVVRTTHGGHLGFLGLPGSAWGYRAMDTQVLEWIDQPGMTTPQIDRSPADAL